MDRDNFCYDMNALFNILYEVRKPAVNVVLYVIQHMQHETSMFFATNKQIAEDLHLSRSSVTRAMSALQELDFMRQVAVGQWMINPRICFWDNINNVITRELEFDPALHTVSAE